MASLEWRKQSSPENIELYSASDDQGLPWIKISTSLPVEYWQLLNLLRDTESATSWVDNASTIKLLQRPDENTDIVHTVINAPWPFSDREMYTVSTVSFDIASQSMKIDVSQLRGPEQLQLFSVQTENSNAEMMKKVQGSWTSQRISEELTQITWTGTGLAGGSIPDWLSASQMKSSTVRTFTKLREKIIEKKYLNKPLAYQFSMKNHTKPAEKH